MSKAIKLVKKKTQNPVDDARKRIEEWKAQAEKAFPERKAPIRALTLCSIVRSNLIFFGEPGTAKSMLANSYAKAFGGGSFQLVFTPFTTPDDFLGPKDITAYKAGEIKRVTEGMAPKAHVYFMDEGFKSNSASLNANLALINEHVYHEGPNVYDVPLRVGVLAANEFPDAKDNLDAFESRFLFRFDVPPLNEFQSHCDMMNKDLPEITARIHLEDLELLEEEAKKIPLSLDVNKAIWDIGLKLRAEGIKVHDRTKNKIGDILRAHALMEGDSEVNTSHLSLLTDMLWKRPEQKPTVNAVVKMFCSPWVKDMKAAEAIVDRAKTDLENVISSNQNTEAACEELGAICMRLKKLTTDASDGKHSLLTKLSLVDSTTVKRQVKDLHIRAETIRTGAKKQLAFFL